eukprot:1608950-Rhodomonas_salina.2
MPVPDCICQYRTSRSDCLCQYRSSLYPAHTGHLRVTAVSYLRTGHTAVTAYLSTGHLVATA